MVRDEYPRPRLCRENNWECLNGAWQFEIDADNSKKDEEFLSKKTYSDKIIVPFAPESRLSGIENTDMMLSVWYKREINVKKETGRVLLHFGAVDYKTRVWIDGRYVGEHVGGWTPFYFDITDLIKDGKNTVIVNAYDNSADPLQATGKQQPEGAPEGCCYTRTTGIWQTVWLEYVPDFYIKNVLVMPNVEDNSAIIRVNFSEFCKKRTVKVKAFIKGEVVGEKQVVANSDNAVLTLPLSVLELWFPQTPTLYDLEVAVGDDAVKTYFGMRSVSVNGNKFEINGESIFMRLVLDQAYYPDGVMTAPSDEDIKNDILLSQSVGFNGARMHMKIFEPRYSYWADKLGYIIWSEYPNWGLDDTNTSAALSMLPEWLSAVERDYNSPAIIGWCPFNETGPGRNKQFFELVYNATKALDPTRPVIDSSGYYHAVTDIFDVHLYENNVEAFYNFLKPLLVGEMPFYNDRGSTDAMAYNFKQPYFVSEFGGISINLQTKNYTENWGYSSVDNAEAFYENYKGIIDVLLDNPFICGFCYTQITDIMQEQNGIYYYDRTPKFDAKRLYEINVRKAEIEK